MPWHILLPFLLLGILVGASQFKPVTAKTPPTPSPDEKEDHLDL